MTPSLVWLAPEGGLCCCVKIGFHDVTGAEHASLQERERHGSALQGFLRNRRAHSFLYTRSARGFQETPIRSLCLSCLGFRYLQPRISANMKLEEAGYANWL